MKQHFVPRCYLKGFSDENGFLYTLDIGLVFMDRNPGVKRNNITGVCIEEDYYNISRSSSAAAFYRINQHDELYVESKILSNKESNYQEVRDRLISGVDVTQEDFDFIAEFIVQLKLRNVFYREIILERNYKQWIDKSIGDLLNIVKKENKIPGLTKEIMDGIADVVKLKDMTDTSFAKNTQLHSLIERAHPEHASSAIIKDAILNASWTILEAPENSNVLFITSDNPGFSLDINGKIHNTRFAENFALYLPLTARHCLVVSDATRKDKPPILKKIAISSKQIRMINWHSKSKINQYLIGFRRDELKELSELLKAGIKILTTQTERY